jgi:hypothetical protein
MAKNFPYFKFIATEWLTGNIVFESLDTQGMFINICSLYWVKDGVLSLEDLNKRYKNHETILILISNGYIFVENGFISIEFLNEQLREANHISLINSEKGKKSAALKALKTKETLTVVEPNTTSFQPNSTNKRKEKKRKEKKRKEEYSENEFSAPKEFKKPFEDFYFEKTGEKYYWTGKDASKCNSVSKKIIFKIKERNPQKIQISDSEIISGFTYILSIINDSWILSNLSMAIIDSKFNEIILQKNGKQSTSDARKQSLENLRAESRAVLAKHSNTNGGDGSIQFKSEPD